MRTFLILAPALLGLSACSYNPELYARYEPSGAEDVWSKGLRLHTAHTPVLDFTSGFVGKTHEGVQYDTTWTSPIRFTVLVRNTGDSAILIEPTRFRVWAPETSLAIRSMDPEVVIRQARKDLVVEEDRYAAAQAVDALVTLPLALISAFASRTPEEAEADRKFWDDKRETDQAEQERHDRKVGEAITQVDQWSETSLRKTTLFPGTQIQGLVNFVDDLPLPRPDTLILQYEISPSRYLDLGRYGKVVDTAEVRKSAKKVNNTPSYRSPIFPTP